LHAPRRIFFLALAGTLLLVGALDLAVGMSTKHSIARRLMAHARESTGAQVVGLGNSLMVGGFVEASIASSMQLDSRHGAVNLAMGSTSPVEHLLALRYGLQHGIRPRTVVYGFFDFQLTHPVEFSTSELIGNHAMLYYVEPEYARRFYRLSFHDRVEFQIMRHFELFVDRSAVWRHVELVRRALAQQGMPPEQENSMGRAVDFRILEYPSASAFISECGRASHNPLIPPIREIALQSEAAGANVYFVEMPMPPDHVRMFYDQPPWSAGYRMHLEQMIGELGAHYIDASHWMPDEISFHDPVHLNSEGAQGFSRRLGEYLREIDVSKRENDPGRASL
jgi:hypothetical protein